MTLEGNLTEAERRAMIAGAPEGLAEAVLTLVALRPAALPPLPEPTISAMMHELAIARVPRRKQRAIEPQRIGAGLQQMQNRIRELAKTIATPGIAAAFSTGELQAFKNHLGVWAALAEDATADPMPAPPEDSPGAYRGRIGRLPLNLVAASVFRDVTGRQPARVVQVQGGGSGGPFVEFLARLFEARGCGASAENEAKRAIQHLKRMEK